MAHTLKNVYLCPRCNEGITSEVRPKLCPGCRYEFARPNQAGYIAPLTLTEQFAKFKNTGVFAKFVAELPIEKANDILNDAHTIIASLAAKNASVSDIRILVEFAKGIGEIACRYDEFLRAGGKHAHSLLNPPTIKETQDGNTTTDGDGTPVT